MRLRTAAPCRASGPLSRLPFTSLRMTINVGKTKSVVFLENPAVRAARPPFTFTLSQSFPTPLSVESRIKTKIEMRLRRHSPAAAQEIVRIPAYSIGVVTAVVGDSTAIVEFANMGKVELRVTDLRQIDLALVEVDCFKYLGLQVDHGLKMEEATKAGVNNVNFAHSKLTATLHSLKQLPRRGNNAALSPLMRLQMWRSCVLTVALDNLRYLRTKGQVHKLQAAVSLSMKRTFGHFEQPLPLSLDLGIPPLQLQQALQLAKLHFRYTYGSPTSVPALLYSLRRAGRGGGPADSIENRVFKAFNDLNMSTSYPSLDPLPPSVTDINTKKKEKAYGNSLKHQVSEVWRRKVLTDSPPLPAGQVPEGRMSAFVNHTYADLSRNLFTPAPYLRSFSADSAFYLFRLRTQDQNIIPTQEPRPNGLRQTQYLQRLCPLCAGGHVGSEAHFYLSCPRTSPLTVPLVAELGVRVPWQQYTEHQRMAVLLGTIPHGLQVKFHKAWIATILPLCHGLATKITCTVQKDIQEAAIVAGMTADQLRALFSTPPSSVGGLPLRLPSPETPSDDE